MYESQRRLLLHGVAPSLSSDPIAVLIWCYFGMWPINLIQPTANPDIHIDRYSLPNMQLLKGINGWVYACDLRWSALLLATRNFAVRWAKDRIIVSVERRQVLAGGEGSLCISPSAQPSDGIIRSRQSFRQIVHLPYVVWNCSKCRPFDLAPPHEWYWMAKFRIDSLDRV